MNAAPPGFQSVHLVTRTPRFDLARTRSILDQFTKFKCPHTRGNLYFFTTILLCCCCIPIKRNRAFTQHRILTVVHRGSICATVKIKSSIMTHCSEGKNSIPLVKPTINVLLRKHWSQLSFWG